MKRTSLFITSFLLLTVSFGAAQRGEHGNHGNGEHNGYRGGAAPRQNFSAPSHNMGGGQAFRSESRQNFPRAERPSMPVQSFKQAPIEHNHTIAREQRGGDARREFRNEGSLGGNRQEFRNDFHNGRHEWRDEHHERLKHQYSWYSGFHTGIFVNFGPPRPRYFGSIGYAPGSDFVWVDGYWAWDGNEYVWIDGYWARVPYYGAAWNSGFWAPRHSGFVWFDGYWR